MAKSKTLCTHCDAKITSKMSFCPNCNQPTVFATVDERTAWELEQWSKQRPARKKVVAARVERPAAPAAKPAEQHADVPAIPAARIEPIKRVATPRPIHPAVARARAQRQVAAVPSEPAASKPAAREDRVIVLPDAPVVKMAPPAPMRMVPPVAMEVTSPAPVKTPVRAVKKAEPAIAAPKKEKPVPAAKKESAAKAPTTQAAKPRPKAARTKAPKMAPMPIEMPVAKTNGNGNGHSNGHANGNGHASNGNGMARDAVAEQTEILRELLQRVTAIEEKMPAPRARRRWLKR